MSFVSIKHLNKFYTKDVPVITDMNLEFPATGLNIVVGKSGCGKTTLLNAIGTMDNDYTGDIIVDGQNLHSFNNKEMSDYKNFGIGYIFQKDDLFEELTVEENLKIVLRMQSKKADIGHALEQVGLRGFENRKIKYLSGGERQRVSIARVILKDCKVILADEPTSALDSKNGHRIFQLLKDISKERLVIAVTHDTKKAFAYADRIIKLSDGNVLEDQIINEGSSEGYKINHKRSNPLALLPIFKFQFSHGLFINIFVACLIALAMCVCSISNDQQYVKDEYDKYQELGYSDVNVKRMMLTQIENGIDDFFISKVDKESSPFEYLREVSYIESVFTEDEIRLLNEYEFANITKANRSVGKLYMKYLSPSSYAHTSATSASGASSDYGWNCIKPSIVDYYMIDPDGDYNYSGSFPTIGSNEMLVTDTFADMYMKRFDKSYTGNINDIIGVSVDIYEAYHSVADAGTGWDYVYYDTVSYEVTGIIHTGQLNYCSYDSSTDSFIFFNKLETQTENDYMNPFVFVPDIALYVASEINSSVTANREHPFTSDALDIDGINYNNTNICSIVKAFKDDVDYRFYLYPKFYSENLLDNPYIDRNNRLIAKGNFSETNPDLIGNEVIMPSDVAKKVFSDFSNGSASSYLNKTVSLDFVINDVTITKNVTIKGFAKEADDSVIYISDDLYKELFNASLPEDTYSVRVSLKGLSYEERYALMEELYDNGYILSPVDILPGAYSEFIYEKSIGVFDEGEEGNISLYNLYSEYYNFDNVKKVNRLLEILSTILSFTIVVAIIVTLGCIYLNERKNRLHIFKLSILGVTPVKIFIMQLVTYVLMAIIAFLLTLFGTRLLVNIINDSVGLTFEGMNSYGKTIRFTVERIRIVLTDGVYTCSCIAAAITLVIGMLCSAIAIKQYKK